MSINLNIFYFNLVFDNISFKLFINFHAEKQNHISKHFDFDEINYNNLILDSKLELHS